MHRAVVAMSNRSRKQASLRWIRHTSSPPPAGFPAISAGGPTTSRHSNVVVQSKLD